MGQIHYRTPPRARQTVPKYERYAKQESPFGEERKFFLVHETPLEAGSQASDSRVRPRRDPALAVTIFLGSKPWV
jgi:hypothetical protein